jgi:hypothetical protein
MLPPLTPQQLPAHDPLRHLWPRQLSRRVGVWTMGGIKAVQVGEMRSSTRMKAAVILRESYLNGSYLFVIANQEGDPKL